MVVTRYQKPRGLDENSSDRGQSYNSRDRRVFSIIPKLAFNFADTRRTQEHFLKHNLRTYFRVVHAHSAP